MKLFDISQRKKVYLPLLTCIGLYLIQFTFIVKYAVNMPFSDEWYLIAPNGFLFSPTLSNLFAQHNENRIVTTKLFILLLYNIDGWNIANHQIINFIIYGFLVSWAIYMIKKVVPQLPFWILLSFTIFLLSTISWQNHTWAFQTLFHFSLLFLFLSIWFLFNEKQKWQKLLCGVIFAWLAIYSLSNGLVGSFIVLIGYSFFKLIRLWQNNEKNVELFQLIVIWILIGGAIGLFFVGYSKSNLLYPYPPFVLPYEESFWQYFLNLLSSGFGFGSSRILPGCIILLFLVIPIIGEIYKRSFNPELRSWIIIVSTLALVGSLCSIAMGRGGMLDIPQSKSSRYTEIVVFLIPLSVAMWIIFLDNWKKMCNSLLLVFWICCIISFHRNWDFFGVYSEVAKERKAEIQCIKDYYNNGGEANCPTISSGSIASSLDFAKTMKLSFVEEISNNESNIR